MANKYTTKLTADTSQHDAALKKSASEVYKYNKRVDEAQVMIGKFTKKIPQIAVALGVAKTAMDVFKRTVADTESVSDGWGITISQINATLDTLSYRLQGIGFGDFIQGLKESARAAKEAYESLDRLQEMTVFMDKSTAKYNYDKAVQEKIIKDRKSTKKEVEDAQAELKRLRENYQREQNALANQAMVVYNDDIKAEFAKIPGLGEKAFEKYKHYLNDIYSKDKAVKRYNQLQAELQRHSDAGNVAVARANARANHKYKHPRPGEESNYAAYRREEKAAIDRAKREKATADRIEKSEEYNALRVIAEMPVEKLQEANGHYINAMRIQEAIVRDEIQQMEMINRANTRVEKNLKSTTPTPDLSEFEKYKKQLEGLKKEREDLLFKGENNWTTEEQERMAELNKLIDEYTKKIQAIEDYNPNPVTPDFSKMYEDYKEYVRKLEQEKENIYYLLDTQQSDLLFPTINDATARLVQIDDELTQYNRLINRMQERMNPKFEPESHPLEQEYQKQLDIMVTAEEAAQRLVKEWRLAYAKIEREQRQTNFTPDEQDLKDRMELMVDLYNDAVKQVRQIEFKILDANTSETLVDEIFNSIPFIERKLKGLELKAEAAITLDDVKLYNEIQKQIEAVQAQLSAKRIQFGLEVAPEINTKEFSDQLINVFDSVGNLGSQLGDLFDSEVVTEFFNAFNKGLSVLNATVSVIENINKLMEVLNALKAANTAATAKQTAATAMDTAASGANASAKASESVAGATAAGAAIPFPYNLIAIAAGIAAVLAALSLMGSFADGGIIGGGSYVGDHGLARVNSGEMILNQREQSRLWRVINGAEAPTNGTGSVSFKIKGSDLVGVLENYNSKINRVI